MSKKYDSLGDRMKGYENIARNYLTRRIPTIIRVDGKAFHTFTRGMEKPFDRILMTTMQNTMKYLCENIQGCVFGYTQSDEITLVLTDYATITTDAWFGYNIQKMCSVSASMAMFWCKAQDAIPILRSLKGQKFLIKGNHDRYNDNKFLREFVKVTEYLEVKDGGRTVILCHYPIPCFKNHFYGSFHLYGHVHNSFEWNMMEHDKYLMEELYTTPCQMFNVGAMMPWMDYTPRTLDEIIAANSHNEAVRNK